MSSAPEMMQQAPFEENSFLEDAPFADRISPEDLAILCRYVCHHQIGQGELLWSEGEVSDRLSLVLSGRIKLLKETAVPGRPVVLGLFGPGALISDSSFAVGDYCLTSAAAVVDSQLVSLSREDFKKLTIVYPLLANRILSEVLQAVANQLRHAYSRLVAIF